MFGEPRSLAVVASGETLGDVLEAFEQLGIDDTRARQLGVGVFKVGLVWPLEPTAITELADSAAEILCGRGEDRADRVADRVDPL